jgi:membrane-bound hydrogenase subunit mbhJ
MKPLHEPLCFESAESRRTFLIAWWFTFISYTYRGVTIFVEKGLSKSFKKALWVYHINSGSCNGCDIEIIAALCPRYDVERFGIKLVGSPRHADVLLITGPVTRQMVDKVKRAYEQIPEPKAVICVGNCGNTGDVFYESYNLVGPVDAIIPVDVYVIGCPPRPENIINGVTKAWMKLETLEAKP